jgi:hypothetical protein
MVFDDNLKEYIVYLSVNINNNEKFKVHNITLH